MTPENGYVWLTYAWYGSDWWTRGPNVQTNYVPFNCSIEKRQSFVKGTYSIDHFPFVEEESYNETTDIGLVRYYLCNVETKLIFYCMIPQLKKIIINKVTKDSEKQY